MFNQDSGTSAGKDDYCEQTAWSRLFAGLLLAQGLAYGSQHLCTAGFLASTDGNHFEWATLWGLVLLHILQGMSLLIGAGLTGAGQRQGMLFGGLIGLVHGLIFLIVQGENSESLSLVAVCGQPILFAAIGTLGGRIGMLIWKPMPVLQLGGLPENAPKVPWNALSFLQYFEGPVSFGRVVVGMLVVVIGVVWSNLILSIIIGASGGSLVLSTHLQDRLLLFEISALATLAGSGLAGATTWNGLKQGLCVGMASSVILVGIQLGSPKAVLETTLFMIISTMFLSLAGGWFGGQLFPPVAQRRRRGADIFSHRY